MNTRQAIQPNSTPAVLNLSFSNTRSRFIAGLSDGLRVFRTDSCLTTYHPGSPPLPNDGGLAIAEALDDRYIAFVSGGRSSLGKGSIVVFWDCVLESEISRLDFYEPILGLRLNTRWLVVILRDRSVVFEYQQLKPQHAPAVSPTDDSDDGRTEVGEDLTFKGPNKVKSLHPTSPTPYAVASLQNELLVIPAQTPGQVQLVPLSGGSKRVLKAHNTALRCLALSPSATFTNGGLLATTSEQGTLVRVFDIKTLDQIAEFRRGVEKAVIFDLAFSDGGRWLACTSDKGTIHIFDLRPQSPGSAIESSNTATNVLKQQETKASQHRKSASQPTPHRLSGGLESISGRSSSPSTAITSNTVTYQGSIQEYYGLRPPPPPVSRQAAAASAVQAFRQSPFAPRIMKDVRSVASLSFYIGNDPPHWQGGVAYSWTMAPGGTRKRVRNPVPALPSEPSGRPPKGVVAFAPAVKASRTGGEAGTAPNDDDGAKLYVLGGGSDARWELFELLPAEGGGWVLINRGFRRYLERQFVD